jgi:hypothetical protein
MLRAARNDGGVVNSYLSFNKMQNIMLKSKVLRKVATKRARHIVL